VATTTSIKRAFLEDAFDASKANGKGLRATLRENESNARSSIAAGSLASISANGRSHTFAMRGLAPEGVVDLWRELIDLHDSSKQWLTHCAKYALNPVEAELYELPLSAAANPVPVTDADIYEWMIGSSSVDGSVRNWHGKLIAITEVRSDYSGLLTQ
jgi:hypothetical protein